jgi:uncharacterized membrane protein YedE/YeeE
LHRHTASIIQGKLVAESGVISWLRIQELFRCQSFHWYGVIGSPIVVGLLSIQLIKHLPLRSIGGQLIVIAGKNSSYGIWIGGALFGMGWAITGTCPGPLFAQLGSGVGVAAVIVLAALTGTWTYNALPRSSLTEWFGLGIGALLSLRSPDSRR